MDLASATLVAVPAVPFRVAFAREVNAVCADAATRPTAIAVELGPVTTLAARAWLHALGTGPAHRTRLPTMITLVRRNRLLRPAARESAMRLQRQTGEPLHALSPDVLRTELGYAGLEVLPLSPTDALTEAIRCACELGVPLYGVDLEEAANPLRFPILVEDPGLACRDLRAYVQRNASTAARCYDPVIDARREFAMAARLKAVMRRHPRVLFVGALGSWNRLAALLADRSVAPATTNLLPRPRRSLRTLRRAVLHPSLAARWIDAVPAIALEYERTREHPRLGSPRTKGTRRSFKAGDDAASACSLSGTGRFSWASLPCQGSKDRRAFDALLAAISDHGQAGPPDLALILSIARATLSPPDCRELAAALMRFPWATPASVVGALRLEPAQEAGAPEYLIALSEPGGESESAFASILMGRTPLPAAIDLPQHWQNLDGDEAPGRPLTVAPGSAAHASAAKGRLRMTARLPPVRRLALDDEPLEALLYGAPTPGPSSAELFGRARPILERVRRAIKKGREEEALREMRTLCAETLELPADGERMLVDFLQGQIPQVPYPVVADRGIAYERILKPIFDDAWARDDASLLDAAGTLLYRWHEARARYGDARAVVSVMLSHAQAWGNLSEEGVLTNNLAYEYLLEGDWDRAEPGFRSAIALFERLADEDDLANARANLLTCQFGRLGLPEARSLEREIEAAREALQNQSDWRERKAFVLLARIREHESALDEAIALTQRAVECARNRPTPPSARGRGLPGAARRTFEARRHGRALLLTGCRRLQLTALGWWG